MSGKVIAIDFDGVIRMWTDDILLPFDPIFPGAIEFIKKMQDEGNMVYIHTARELVEIIKYLEYKKIENMKIGVLVVNSEVFGELKQRFIMEKLIGLSNTKYPADVYIDDRALRFQGNWEDTGKEVEELLK